MIETKGVLLTVTDLKQYSYCPRVCYYEQCLPDVRPRTYKMDAGALAHEAEQKRAARRKLHSFGLETGQRFFEVPITSARYHLSGKVDEVIVSEGPPKTVIPVDYKLARQVSPHYRLQVAAYAMMLEDAWQCDVSQGFVYLIPLRHLEPVVISDALRKQVVETIDNILKMIDTERMPPPTTRRNRCASCEFRRMCNDL